METAVSVPSPRLPYEIILIIIKHVATFMPETGDYDEMGSKKPLRDEHTALLRLSQTNHFLREHALPLFWNEIPWIIYEYEKMLPGLSGRGYGFTRHSKFTFSPMLQGERKCALLPSGLPTTIQKLIVGKSMLSAMEYLTGWVEKAGFELKEDDPGQAFVHRGAIPDGFGSLRDKYITFGKFLAGDCLDKLESVRQLTLLCFDHEHPIWPDGGFIGVPGYRQRREDDMPPSPEQISSLWARILWIFPRLERVKIARQPPKLKFIKLDSKYKMVDRGFGDPTSLEPFSKYCEYDSEYEALVNELITKLKKKPLRSTNETGYDYLSRNRLRQVLKTLLDDSRNHIPEDVSLNEAFRQDEHQGRDL